MGGSDDDDNASATTTTTTTAASILETTSLQLNISKLHSDLSRASEGNADLHARMEARSRVGRSVGRSRMDLVLGSRV